MKKNFNDLIETHETPVLVDFFATWCGPCQTMTPVLENLAEEYQEKLKIIKIDIDKNPAVAQKFQVRGVPTFILFNQGDAVWRKSGAMPAHLMKSELNGHIS